MRMQSKYIKEFQYKPTYTEDDLDFIRQAQGDTDIVFAEMANRHPKTSTRSFYRWIEQVAMEGIDTRK